MKNKDNAKTKIILIGKPTARQIKQSGDSLQLKGELGQVDSLSPVP